MNKRPHYRNAPLILSIQSFSLSFEDYNFAPDERSYRHKEKRIYRGA